MRALDIDENASDAAHEVVLCARGVAYALRDGTRLLDDVDITLRPGEAVALIGPSGAGKTTLLATLAARAGSRLVAGAVTANGRRYGAGGFAAFGTVARKRRAPAEPDAASALRFAATLRGADPKRVDALLVDTGLMERADVRARLLSGGQRKRLSLGLELIHSPAVLLADEPTSGLDSVAAAATTQLLLEHSAEMTVAAVVHQPPIAVFLKLRVAVLAGGRLCYDGATADVASATCFALIFHHMAQLRGRLWVFGGAMILSGLLMQQIGLLLGGSWATSQALPIYIPINLIGLVYSGFFFTNHNLTKQKIGYPLWYQ
ncbi:ATPase [Aureococcus anophagefferens]|nr:ATPase [Aureococcus anophagefferens]